MIFEARNMKPKHQRLALALVALVALIGAALLAANALRQEASYFYTPATLKTAKIPVGKAIRLGRNDKARIGGARSQRYVSALYRARS